MLLTLFGTAQRHRETNGSRGDAADDEPDGFVGRRSCEKTGDVGTERVGRIDSYDQEHNATSEQGKRKSFIHKLTLIEQWLTAKRSSDRSATGNEVDEDHDHRNHQKDMNKSAQRGAGHHSEQPEDY